MNSHPLLIEEIQRLRAENAGLRRVYDASVKLRHARDRRAPDRDLILACIDAETEWESALNSVAAQGLTKESAHI